MQLNSDSMSLESVVGKDNLTRLEGAAGRETVARITGRLEGAVGEKQGRASQVGWRGQWGRNRGAHHR